MTLTAELITPTVQIISQIITHTPHWVWGVFVLLLWLGGRQMRSSTQGLRRVIALPLGMTALSLVGAVSAFGGQLAVLMAWAVAASACAAAVLATPLPRNTRFDSTRQTFHVPGSALPLVLMLSIFTPKYALGVATAMRPELAQYPALALPCAALLGACSGLFAGRTLRLLRLRQGASHAVLAPAAPGAVTVAV